MGEHTKHSTSRVELRERIILAAVELFTTNGIKSITMDEIAASWVSLSALSTKFSGQGNLVGRMYLEVPEGW